MLFERGVISLEVFKKSKMAFPPSAPCTLFCRPRPAWECEFYIFQHLCGARVLYVRFGPLCFSAKVAFGDTSNVILVILSLMQLKCKCRTQFVLGCFNLYMLCMAVLCSFGFDVFLFRDVQLSLMTYCLNSPHIV